MKRLILAIIIIAGLVFVYGAFGLRNRPIYIKVKNCVEAQGYTIEQIENVTAQQVKNLLNLTDEEWNISKSTPGCRFDAPAKPFVKTPEAFDPATQKARKKSVLPPLNQSRATEVLPYPRC